LIFAGAKKIKHQPLNVMPKNKKPLKLLLASKPFWLCNSAAWLAINSTQSLIDAFDGDSVYVNFLNHLPQTILGMLTGLCIHIAHAKLQWYKHPSISLIPYACLIAVIFGFTDTLINLFDWIPLLPEACAPEYPRSPNYYCGKSASYFSHSVFSMLIWAMFYLAIQAERSALKHTNLQHTQTKQLDFKSANTVKAVLALSAIIHINSILNVLGWASDSTYLFSKLYYFNHAVDFIVAILFSSYVFLIKPTAPIFGSRLLPWAPTLCVVTLSCSALSMGASSAFWNFYYLKTNIQASFLNTTFYVLFGSNYGHWSSKGQLGGQLQGYFTYILLAILFFIHYRFTEDWHPDTADKATELNVRKIIIFWALNIAFWLFFGTLIYTTDLMGLTELGKDVPRVSTASFLLTGLFIGALLHSHVEHLATQKIAAIYLGLRLFFISIACGLLHISTLWLINYAYIFVTLDGYGIEKYTHFVSNHDYVLASIIVSCMSCGLWSLICYMNKLQQLQQSSTIKQLQLEMNMKEVQLNALAGKVDPHFIFNALNNIRTLVDEDSEKARSALVVLSDILRSPITNNAQNKITVAEEMILVRNYVSLSKIQLEDLLIYTEDVSNEANTALIPAMMLQIMVENAIKHGISQLPDGGMLSLHLYKKEQQLICRVTNNGQLHLKSNHAGFGVGVTAIKERLALLYNDKASFILHEEQDRVIALLILPFERLI
jgi:two-component system, LytTR family, sensor kinase